MTTRLGPRRGGFIDQNEMTADGYLTRTACQSVVQPGVGRRRFDHRPERLETPDVLDHSVSLLTTERLGLGNLSGVVDRRNNDGATVQIDADVPRGIPSCLAG